jgi:hypothetical protein
VPGRGVMGPETATLSFMDRTGNTITTYVWLWLIADGARQRRDGKGFLMHV